MTRVVEEKVVGGMHISGPPAAPAAPYVAPYVAPPAVHVAAPDVAPYSPYTPPAKVPAAAARKTIATKIGFLDDHKKIKKFIDTEGKKYLCPTTDEIVGAVGLSAEDVRLHIKVMEEDESAVPVQKGDNPAICSADGLNRLVDNLRKLRV